MWDDAFVRDFIPNAANIAYEDQELDAYVANTQVRDAEHLLFLSRSIVMPYPVFGRARSLTLQDIIEFKRNHLISFYGSLQVASPAVRGRCKEQFAGQAGAVWVEAGRALTFDHDAAMRLYSESVFVLSPPGDSPSARRTYDVILTGAIPVIVYTTPYALPFANFLKWSEFSVLISFDQLQTTNIVDIVRAIPPESTIRMQERILQVRRHFVFHLGVPSAGDAIDMFVHELAAKVAPALQLEGIFSKNH